MAGREDLSKPPAPSEWSNAVKNCKRLREAFLGTICPQENYVDPGDAEKFVVNLLGCDDLIVGYPIRQFIHQHPKEVKR